VTAATTQKKFGDSGKAVRGIVRLPKVEPSIPIETAYSSDPPHGDLGHLALRIAQMSEKVVTLVAS
jgi:hypothetical protein